MTNSPFLIEVLDGGTVPSVNLDGEKTYIDIGSGNIFKLTWNTPDTQANEIDYYDCYFKIEILKGDTISGRTLIRSIGKVNEFYLSSEFISKLFLKNSYSKYTVTIQLTAKSKQGSDYDIISNIITVPVSKGCGLYTRVESIYSQPVMKRAIAFAKTNMIVTEADIEYLILADSSNVILKDSEGTILRVKDFNIGDLKSKWTLMQDFYLKNSENNWQLSDISYETLVDETGELILDSNNEPVYSL